MTFQAHGATHPWKEADPAKLGIKAQNWQKFLDFTYSKTEGHSTNALLILYKDKLIHHSTANGFKKGQPHRQWSVSKSFSSALIGIAIKKGILELNTSVDKYYPVHKDSKFSPTVKDLLGMSSGLDWNEGYESNPLKSNVIAMLYTEGFKDMASFTASRPSKYIPGEKFYYSSGETNLMMGMLKKSMGINDYSNYPWTQLFDPLQIKTATWERDQSGTFVGSSYLHMSPEDLAKFGYLYLKDGIYNKKQVIPKKWVKYSTELSQGLLKKTPKEKERVETYGAQWWLNKNLPNHTDTKPYPGFPTDAFMALGHHGQILAVVPSKDLVIVRNGADKDKNLDKVKFFKLLMEAL